MPIAVRRAAAADAAVVSALNADVLVPGKRSNSAVLATSHHGNCTKPLRGNGRCEGGDPFPARSTRPCCVTELME
jgi:hypothetical protein